MPRSWCWLRLRCTPYFTANDVQAHDINLSLSAQSMEANPSPGRFLLTDPGNLRLTAGLTDSLALNH